jgi:hypothetical protein
MALATAALRAVTRRIGTEFGADYGERRLRNLT